MISINKTTTNMAESRGMIVDVQEVSGFEVVTLKRKDNNMMIVSFKNNDQTLEVQQMTTMNAEDYESIPKNISTEEEFREVIKIIGDYIS